MFRVAAAHQLLVQEIGMVFKGSTRADFYK